jgi:two-component system, OmpR family, sensor histidine kinase QseC
LMVLVESANGLLRRLEAGFERERRFTADAAHELRTPIAALKVHLQNLIDEMGGKETGPLGKLKQGVDRMGHLVEQILTLNRTTPEHYIAQFACIDLFAVTKRVMESGLIGQSAEKSQRLEFEGLVCEVYGDLFALETLILNLLGNAVKYTPSGGRIIVKISIVDGAVTLQVKDSGPGIPAQMRERVFERFYRLGGDRHESGVIGCGLGLSIARHIVSLHGAAIELSDSGMGSGLCVTVTFPRERQCSNGEVMVVENRREDSLIH